MDNSVRAMPAIFSWYTAVSTSTGQDSNFEHFQNIRTIKDNIITLNAPNSIHYSIQTIFGSELNRPDDRNEWNCHLLLSRLSALECRGITTPFFPIQFEETLRTGL